MFIEHFDALPENFVLLTATVKPPGHETLSVFAVCNTDISIYDLYISDFFISVTSGHAIFMTLPL